MSPPAPLPLPEAIAPGPWQIEAAPGDGRASMVALGRGGGGRLLVPLGGGERERVIRRHELAHVAWTPRGRRRPYGIPETVMQHSEDARIMRRLSTLGMPARVRVLSDDELLATVEALAAGDLGRLEVASLLLATSRTPDGELMAELVAEVDRALPPIVRAIWWTTVGAEPWPKPARALEAAARLVALFRPPDDAPRASRTGSLALPGALAPARVGKHAAGGRDGDPRPPRTIPIMRARRSERDAAGVDWAPLTIVEPALPLTLPARRRGRAGRPASEGRLADPARLHRDGQAFRARRAARATPLGAALIDLSGSMAIDARDLERLVAASPGAVVATYCGQADGQRGALYVVARGGRRAAEHQLWPPGHMNLVDGPALEWLGRQPGPRVWVSDGAVTGRGDRPSPALDAERDALLARHAILRVDTLGELLGRWE